MWLCSTSAIKWGRATPIKKWFRLNAKMQIGDLVKYCFDRNNDVFIITAIQDVFGQQAKFTLYSTKDNVVKYTRAKFWFNHLEVVSHASG